MRFTGGSEREVGALKLGWFGLAGLMAYLSFGCGRSQHLPGAGGSPAHDFASAVGRGGVSDNAVTAGGNGGQPGSGAAGALVGGGNATEPTRPDAGGAAGQDGSSGGGGGDGAQSSAGAASSSCPASGGADACFSPRVGSFDNGYAAHCEVREDHSLWCWGDGNRTYPTWQEPRFPLQVGSDMDWLNVSVGREAVCGLRGAGSLWCFGKLYKPGAAPTIQLEQAPVQIGGDQDWASVSVGEHRYMAVKQDGSLWRWGSWFQGTGTNLTALPLAQPTVVGSDTDWASVTIGLSAVCALKTGGELDCLGSNSGGLLGDGTKITRFEPAPVSGGKSWLSVAVGSKTCGVRADGTLWCWGSVLGNVPTPIGTDTDWVEVAGHDVGVVGRRASGNVYSLVSDASDPLRVVPIDDRGGYVALSPDCGRREDGTLWCWGSIGPRGDGTGNVETAPARVGDESDWVSIRVDGVLGLHAGGRVDPMPWNGLGALSPVSELSLSGTGSCAVRSDGSLWCAGPGYSELGPDGVFSAVQQGTSNDWLHLFGLRQIWECAIRGTPGASQGTLWCRWPGNDQTWRQAGSATDWTTLNGCDQTCGLRADGSLWCWSVALEPYGAAVSKMAQVGGDRDWTAIAVGGSFKCGIRASGELWCWGKNSVGQLGNGTRDDSAALVQVLPGTRWSSVAAGGYWACGVQVDGSLWCWGDDTTGQLGLGAPGATRLLPERVGTSKDWQFVDANCSEGGITCGIRTGKLYCWGENAGQQISHSGRVFQPPVQVVNGPPASDEFCPYPEDNDKDGYAGCYGDCDDAHFDVSPFAPELCNGIDDNCNQQIDEGCP